MNDGKGPTPYQVTESDMRVLGGFFTVGGAVWTGFLPREYDIGPTGIPQWWIGIPFCIFRLYILLNATRLSRHGQARADGNTRGFKKRDTGD
jgi:hypothetical protein